MAYVYDHYVIAIYPQDKWKEGFKESFDRDLKDAFFSATGASSCDICCTCPVCRGISELFDPDNASEYNNVCSLCHIFKTYFRSRLGGTDGPVLMAHWSVMPDGLIERLYADPHVKKAFVLNHRWHGRDDGIVEEDILGALEHETLSYSGYLSLEEKRPGAVYEIIRDEYFH